MVRRILTALPIASAAVFLAHCVGDDPASSNGSSGGTDSGSGADTSTTPAQDSGTPVDDSGSTPDAQLDAGPPCDTSKPFGILQPLPGDVNSNGGEEYARISGNGLELYFARFAAGGYVPKIFRATRATKSDPWTGSAQVTQLSTRVDGGTATVTAPALTRDGLTIFTQFYDDNSGYGDIFTSTRGSLASSWSTPSKVANVNSGGADDGVWVTAQGERLYWFGGPPFHIRVSTSTAGTFAAPATLTVIAEERAPVLTDDELTMYFTSYSAPPDGGASKRYAYVATRSATNQNFTNATYVPELNIVGNDTIPTWLSPDRCTMLVSSDRNGNFDIFYAERPK